MRVISVAYLAVVRPGQVTIRAGDDAASAGWFSIANLPQLAFDHAEMIDYALTRLRYKLEYTDLGFRLLPSEFTLSDLQEVYEVILGETLDKRNFRRKVMQANVLQRTGRTRTGDGRPAQLYQYRQDAEPEVKARRLFP
jgi:8-oxo-dGTP diphosphatase